MRKGLIATAVAVALFAVGAFAASFNVDADNIASGSDPVVPCAGYVKITFNQPTFSSGVWVTNGAKAEFFEDEVAAPVKTTNCNDGTAQLALTVGSGSAKFGAEPTVANGEATFSFPAVEVELITNASVAVNGVWLP
jgi:hypothetical protein